MVEPIRDHDPVRGPVRRFSSHLEGSDVSFLGNVPAFHDHDELVVLLHGIPASAELWREVLVRLADRGIAAVAPDLPGYGRTRLPDDGDRSLAGAAALIEDWLGDLAVDRAHLVGHDLGAGVAQILAVRSPHRVSRLTLSNGVIDRSWPPPQMRPAFALWRSGAWPTLARTGLASGRLGTWALRRLGFADGSLLSGADARRVFWDGKVHDPRGRREFEAHVAALTNDDTAAVVDDLADIDVPSQLVWGTEDPNQPWDPVGTALRDRLRDPAVTLLDGCGHFHPIECPDGIADALRSFRSARLP